MKRFFIPQKLSSFLMVLLIPAVLFSFVSCGKGGSSADGDDHSEGNGTEAGAGVSGNSNGDGSKNEGWDFPEDFAGDGEPDNYAVALDIKVRSEFIIYVTNDRIIHSYSACNDEAKQIQDHTLITDQDLFTCVHDIYLVSIDDFDVDTEREETLITLVNSNISEEETEGFMQEAERAADEALAERNKKGDVQSIIPPGIEFVRDQAADAAGDPGMEARPKAEESEFYDETTGKFICSSQSDLNSLLGYLKEADPDKTDWVIFLDRDVSIELNASDLSDITLDLDGHNINVFGTYAYTGAESRPLKIEHAASVDLSNLKIDLESAKLIPPDYEARNDITEEMAYWNPQRRWVNVVEISNTDLGGIILPADVGMDGDEAIQKKSDPRESSIFDTYAAVRGENGHAELYVAGPLEDYEVRQEKEKEVLSYLFENGEYRPLTGQSSNNFFYICTDVTMDIGDCMLPNMDYEAICVGKGGKLTLTGTLYVTGGVFRMETYENEGIDLRGLTVVKKHPSPDVIWIGYDPAVGINEDMCRCNTSSGELHLSKSDDRVSITVW